MAVAGLNMSVEDWVRVVNRLDQMAETIKDYDDDTEVVYHLTNKIDRAIDGKMNTQSLELVFSEKELALVESTLPV